MFRDDDLSVFDPEVADVGRQAELLFVLGRVEQAADAAVHAGLGDGQRAELACGGVEPQVLPPVGPGGLGIPDLLETGRQVEVAVGERGRGLARPAEACDRISESAPTLLQVGQVVPSQPVGRADGPAAMLAGLRDRLRPDQWLVAGGISWCLIWVILGLNRWKGNPRRRLALIPAALLILTLWAHAAQPRGTYSPDQAVILHRTAVLGLAEKKSAELYRVPEAAYVKVTNRRGTWIRIRTDKGEGWVPNRALQAVWE